MTAVLAAPPPAGLPGPGRDSARWGVSLLAVAVLHLGGAVLLGRIVPLSLPQPVDAPAIEIDMAPPAPEPAPQPPAPQPPAPPPPAAAPPPPAPPPPTPMPAPEPPPPQPAPPEPTPVQPPPPEPPPVPLPEPEVVLPMPPPPPPPPPVPRPRPPRAVAIPHPQPPREAVTQTVPLAPAPVTPGPVAPAPSIPAPSAVAAPSPQAVASWQGQLVAVLRRNLRYPETATRSRERGTASVTFTMDRSGRVLASRLLSGTGYEDLDQEALAVLQRSQPLPTPPAGMTQETFVLTVPVRFTAP